MNLDGLYTLPRAGRYTNPLNSNDRLPLVYGDLTDAVNGNWALPCIDTVNHVYCFAAHEVLSVGNGNSINIYADNVLVDPGDYTFDESDDYEFEGAIAKITFTATKSNSVITARGKGKDDGGTLIENIVDVLYDFLTVENSFTSSDFDSTKKAMATDIFESQSYKAAGVIKADAKLWVILQQMMGSFLGSAYVNSQNKIVLEIDDGTSVYVSGAVIPKSEIKLTQAKQRKINLINQCPASYAYDFGAGKFRSHTDDSAYRNTPSQGIYGVCKPTTPYQFYWCRDKTSVQTMQSIITTKYGYPTWEIDFEDITLKRSHIDAGDVVAATFKDVYDENENQLVNQFLKILSVRTDYKANSVKFNAVDTGLFMTVAYLADGTYIADGSIKAGGDRDTTVY